MTQTATTGDTKALAQDAGSRDTVDMHTVRRWTILSRSSRVSALMATRQHAYLTGGDPRPPPGMPGEGRGRGRGRGRGEGKARP